MKEVAGSCTLGTPTVLALLQRRNQQNVCRDDSKPDTKILKILKTLKISFRTSENTKTLLQRPAVQCSVGRKSKYFLIVIIGTCHKRHVYDYICLHCN